jgi:hypothetical protein
VRNPNAAWALLVGLLAVGVLGGAGAATRLSARIGLLEAVGAVPLAGLLGLFALVLARRARFEHQRTLGRAGGCRLAALGKLLGGAALLLALTAALALAVFAVLTLAFD